LPFQSNLAEHSYHLQVLFAPLPHRFFVELHEELAAVRCPRNLIAERLDDFADKFPAWQAAIRIFSTHPSVVDGVRKWLYQFESSSRNWQFSDVQVVDAPGRRFEAWEIMDLAELATFVQFL
jgi:hypothetical protein